MRRPLLIASVFSALIMALPDTSFGHGGQYRGPGDTVPPNLGGGGDTTPPGNPGGPGTPGPGAPTTGGRGGQTGPTGPVVPGGGVQQRRPTTGFGGAKARNSAGYEQWEFWWEHNKEPFLDLRNRLAEGGAVSGSAGVLVGQSSKLAVTAQRVTLDDFKSQIMPVLMNALDSDDADIVDSSVLALARSMPAEESTDVFDAIVKTLGHKQDSARQSATISLGVLGSPQARPILIELVKNSAEARKYLKDTKDVPSMIRGFAAISLGMIGDATDIAFLKEQFDRQPDSERDLKTCALLALGMYKKNQEEIIPYLLDVMDRNQTDRLIRSLAPIALSRLDETAVYTAALSPLLQKVRSDKTDDDMMRSCVIALGRLAKMTDKDVLDALYSVIENHTDDQTRHFAFIALAEIGGRDETQFVTNKEAHEKMLTFFLNEVTRPKKLTHQPWAGIALAVYCRPLREQDAAADTVTRAIQKLGEVFKDTNNPSYKGAMAVGLGLLSATQAAEDILKELEKTNDQSLGGYLAVSLGLMSYKDAAEKLRTRIVQKGIEFKFRLNLARGLGLMNDRQSIETLIQLLSESKTLSETASIAQAIGLIGDRKAIEPLTSLVGNSSEKELVRAFAAVALGLLSEKTTLPWNAGLSVGMNYRSKSDAIAELLDIL